MNRREAIEVFAGIRGEAPVVVGPGVSGRMLYEVDHRQATLYQMDMSYPVPIALGLALALPEQPVFALDGDGSLLMGMSSLSTVGRYNPANLTVLVLDNEAYTSTGSIPTATASTCDLAAVGRGAGVEASTTVSDVVSLKSALADAVASADASLIVAKIDGVDQLGGGNYSAMPFDIVESSLNFRRFLQDQGLVEPIWAV